MSMQMQTPPAGMNEGLTFVRTITPEMLKKSRDTLEEKVTALNEVCNGDDLVKRRDAQDAVDEALLIYNRDKTRSDYEDLLSKENPMKEALIEGYITLAKVDKEVDKDLNLVSYKVVDSVKQIDFIQLNAISTKLRLMGAKVKQKASQMAYMTLIHKGLGDSCATTAAEKQRVAADITAAYLKGKDRTVTEVLKAEPSKNALKKALQSLIDEVYFEDNGSGKNTFMVTSGWLHWFEDFITKTNYGKGFLSRSAITPKAVIQAVAGLYHAAFNDYGIKVAIDKENAVALETVTVQKAEEAAA